MKGDPSVVKANLLTSDVDIDADSVSKMSRADATELVQTLQNDKKKLQKLVLAQKAAVKSVRQAHDQSRELARDAIIIMRDAREAQKKAEKRVRRERMKRLQIEEKVNKSTQELKNAFSIVENLNREMEAREAASAVKGEEIDADSDGVDNDELVLENSENQDK